jgi:hypothetical protein
MKGGTEPEIELHNIIAAKQEIDVDHPILPEWAYGRAHEKIKEKIVRNRELDRLRMSDPTLSEKH